MSLGPSCQQQKETDHIIFYFILNVAYYNCLLQQVHQWHNPHVVMASVQIYKMDILAYMHVRDHQHHGHGKCILYVNSTKHFFIALESPDSPPQLPFTFWKLTAYLVSLKIHLYV